MKRGLELEPEIRVPTHYGRHSQKSYRVREVEVTNLSDSKYDDPKICAGKKNEQDKP